MPPREVTKGHRPAPLSYPLGILVSMDPSTWPEEPPVDWPVPVDAITPEALAETLVDGPGPQIPHYAEVYSPRPGRCFRMVYVNPPADTRPTHCENPVAWRGVHENAEGKRLTVDACDGHAGDLTMRRRL